MRDDDFPDDFGGGLPEDVPDVTVILPAAGASSRFAADERKPFVELAGQPLLCHAARRLAALPGVREVVLAVHPDDLDRARGPLWQTLRGAGVTLVVAGEASRAETVWSALQVADPSAEFVAIHDAARPFPSKALWARLLRAAERSGAAVPALPLTDTLKRGEGDDILETLSRAGLYRVQTPQLFRRDLLLDANESALATGGLGETVTDDASLVEAYGHPVKMVLGDPLNLKVTVKGDLAMAEAYLAAGLVDPA